MLTAIFSYADSGQNRLEHNNLEGTWLSKIEPGVPPGLLSYMSDGRVIYSRPITLLTGPGSSLLVGSAQGEWIRTGPHQFASTMFQFASGPGVEFANLVKLTDTLTLKDSSDEMTLTRMVSVFNPDGTLLISFPFTQVFKRVVAGQ